ncbi:MULTISPECIES: hypothetical protein [Burkholderia]|nr:MULTISPECIES: hypothetical protein [Burkholderia]UXZ82595.1 hypothetical protein NUJ31_00730 [Burkholderia multivorans]
MKRSFAYAEMPGEMGEVASEEHLGCITEEVRRRTDVVKFMWVMMQVVD